MKNFLLGGAFALGCIALPAQNCTDFFPMDEGDVMELSHYDGKGKLESRSVHTIKDTRTEGQTFTWTTHLQSYKPNGKLEMENDFDMSCKGDEFYLNMNSMLPSAQMQGMEGLEMSIEGGEMVLPGTLTVGMTLPDAHMSTKASMNGMVIMTMTIDITNRKVVAKEKVTTAAGTFDCFKMEEDVEMKSMMNMTGRNVSWMAPGAGMVKSESYDSKAVMTSRTELTRLEN